MRIVKERLSHLGGAAAQQLSKMTRLDKLTELGKVAQLRARRPSSSKSSNGAPDTGARAFDAGRLGLPLHPTGWYAVSFSSELPAGAVQPVCYFDRDLVLFRTESGRAVLMDAHCPHMGAHLGHGGEVCGESIQCPFHAFRFDTEGACISTPYGGKLPRARARTWPLIEQDGLLLTWFDEAGRPPQWQVPKLPADYGKLYPKTWHALKSHPQETTENSVDFGHFAILHGFHDTKILEPLRTDGHYLTARYSMLRDNAFLPKAPPILTKFRVHVYGLGYSFVEVEVPEHGLLGHHFVLPTPSKPGHITLRVANSLHIADRSRLLPPLRLLPERLVHAIVGALTHRAYVEDVAKDFDVWENKRYLQPPALAEGDGPIGPYRRWAKQFYPQPDAT